MGNCYSSGAAPEIETSLSNAAARPNQRQQQHANFDTFSDKQTPEMPTLSKEEELRQIVQARGDQLHHFVLNIAQLSPQVSRENVAALLVKYGNFDYLETLPQSSTNIDPFTLEYREATAIEDGGVYAGTWNKDTNQFEGLGVRITADGSIYEGYFLQGQGWGKGRTINSQDNEVYTGDFAFGKRCGLGTLATEEGTLYVGAWSEDLKWGKGKETWVDGAFYEGDFLRGLKHGRGFFKWNDQSNYDGEFFENQIQGSGTYNWADNRSYIGQWQENKMHGYGVFTWEDGRKYEGSYVDDKKEGNGRFTWPDGRVYEGLWKDGRQHGLGNYTYADGRTRKGEWIDGKRSKWVNEATGGDFTRSGTIKEPNNVDEKNATIN